jgi:hypothetical protein
VGTAEISLRTAGFGESSTEVEERTEPPLINTPLQRGVGEGGDVRTASAVYRSTRNR